MRKPAKERERERQTDSSISGQISIHFNGGKKARKTGRLGLTPTCKKTLT
jgi:hypothetical protein